MWAFFLIVPFVIFILAAIVLYIVFAIKFFLAARREQNVEVKKKRYINFIVFLLIPIFSIVIPVGIYGYGVIHKYDNYQVILVDSSDDIKETGFVIDEHKVVYIKVDEKDVFWEKANLNENHEVYAYLDIQPLSVYKEDKFIYKIMDDDTKIPVQKITTLYGYNIYEVRGNYYIEERYFKDDIYSNIFNGQIIKVKNTDDIMFKNTTKIEEDKGFEIDGHRVVQIYFYEGYNAQEKRNCEMIKKYNNNSTLREWTYSKLGKYIKYNSENRYAIIQLEEYDDSRRSLNVYKVENDSEYGVYYIDYRSGVYYIDEDYFK